MHIFNSVFYALRISLWGLKKLTDCLQCTMPVCFTPALAFWFVCVTFLLSITTVTMNDNIVTPLLYVHNMFIKNMAIEKHTIHSVSVSDPWECFRHCAKDCDCVTFQLTERICELLDTDQHGAARDLVNRPRTLLFSMQQSVLQVSLLSYLHTHPATPLMCLSSGRLTISLKRFDVMK